MKENIKNVIVESTNSGDIARIEINPAKILYRIFTKSLASSVCSTLEVNSTKGKIFAFGSFYNRNYADVDKSTEPFGTIESDYSGDREHSQEGDVKASINNKLLGSEFNCFGKNLKSVWSMEALQDFISFTNKEEAEKIIHLELATEIIQEMDKGLIEYCMEEGKNYTMTLDSTTTYNQILEEIQKYGIMMATSMKRPPYLSIIASANICGYLASHPNFDSGGVDFNEDVYYFGKIHNIKIYCDALGVAQDKGDFIIILYKSETDRPASSLTYTQYKAGYSFYNSMDSKTGYASFFHNNRYDIIKHPLDDSVAKTNSSKFITYINVSNRMYP